METKLIELYVLICDLYDKHPVLKEQRLSNFKPLFSDQELLTMYLFGHLQGFTQQRQIYDYFAQHWREWFPLLATYQACNRRWNELVAAFEMLIEELLKEAGWQIQASADRVIDSMPVMVAQGTRAKQARVAAELADVGYCATKGQYYRGLKLHVVAARRPQQLPLPEKIYLSPASQHDLSALRELNLVLPAKAALFADKAYDDQELEKEFRQHQSYLMACYKRRRNEPEAAVPTLYNRFISSVRQPIESLFGWLIQKTDVQNASRVRSSQGLKLHCYGKLAVACLLLTFYS